MHVVHHCIACQCVRMFLIRVSGVAPVSTSPALLIADQIVGDAETVIAAVGPCPFKLGQRGILVDREDAALLARCRCHALPASWSGVPSVARPSDSALVPLLTGRRLPGIARITIDLLSHRR